MPSTIPPKKPATTQTTVAIRHVISAAAVPIRSELRPP